MTGVAAWDRGGTAVDRALLVTMAVTICAGAHLLPALSRRSVAWLLWIACLLATVYGHLTFFTHAGLRAGEVRAQQSVQVADVSRQIETMREALAGIKARPVATVAVEISRARTERRIEALQEELTEAKRAARLRDELVGATAAVTNGRAAGVGDPVMSRLAVVTGSNEASIALAVGIGFAILIELTGAFLWYEALRTPTSPAQGVAEPATPATVDPLDSLKDAVEAGLCKPTVASIRVFLGCGQGRAIEMRRALMMPERTNLGQSFAR
ncbi:MAG: hypothetical protein NTY05_04520 [Rhodocyclales bacterium]|nr:hypothetical protein [Rhodocyclales bacterium]